MHLHARSSWAFPDRQASVTGVFVERYQGSKIAESWTEFDALGLLQQLGAVPPLGAQR